MCVFLKTCCYMTLYVVCDWAVQYSNKVIWFDLIWNMWVLLLNRYESHQLMSQINKKLIDAVCCIYAPYM